VASLNNYIISDSIQPTRIELTGERLHPVEVNFFPQHQVRVINIFETLIFFCVVFSVFIALD